MHSYFATPLSLILYTVILDCALSATEDVEEIVDRYRRAGSTPAFTQPSYTFAQTSCGSSTPIGTVSATSPDGSSGITYYTDNPFSVKVDPTSGQVSVWGNAISASTTVNIFARNAYGSVSAPVTISSSCAAPAAPATAPVAPVAGPSIVSYTGFDNSLNAVSGLYCYNGQCFNGLNGVSGSGSYCYAGSCRSTSIRTRNGGTAGCFNSLCYNSPTQQVCYGGSCCSPMLAYSPPSANNYLCYSGQCYNLNSNTAGPCGTSTWRGNNYLYYNNGIPG